MVGSTVKRWLRSASACGVAIAVCNGCVTYPKVTADAPLQVQRGNWVDFARFYQRGRQVDRGDAKETLSHVDESAAAEKRGAAFDVCGILSAAAAGALIGVGAAQASAKEQSWPYFVAGGLGLGLSVTFAVAADGSYVTAADQYNRQLGPTSTTPGDGNPARDDAH
jgi:hypothetical protein